MFVNRAYDTYGSNSKVFNVILEKHNHLDKYEVPKYIHEFEEFFVWIMFLPSIVRRSICFAIC